MNLEQKRSCEDSEPLLVKKITGELLSEEKRFLENHLAQCVLCVAKERELTKEWQSFDSVPAPEIPAELYENTRNLILSHLEQENLPLSLAERTLRGGVRSLLVPFVAGVAITGISYALIRNLIDLKIHQQHVLIALFSLWGILFAGGFWLILEGKRKKSLLLDAVASFSISITVLTLLISSLAAEVDSLRWLAMSATYEVVVASNYLFGTGNTFVAGLVIYACVASFICAFVIGVRRSPGFSQNALLGSFLTSVFLFPAVYLHGSSHNHGFGILAFAAFGTFVGAYFGVGMGYVGSVVFRRMVTPAP